MVPPSPSILIEDFPGLKVIPVAFVVPDYHLPLSSTQESHSEFEKKRPEIGRIMSEETIEDLYPLGVTKEKCKSSSNKHVLCKSEVPF